MVLLGQRVSIAAKEEAEIKMLSVYLPAQVDEGQIRAAIEALVVPQARVRRDGKIQKIALREQFKDYRLPTAA